MAGLLALLGPAATEAEPLKIRIQYATLGQFVPLIPVVPKELYKHYGKSYVVEPVFMAGTGPALTAFAAKELELAALNPQTLGNAVASGQLNAIGIVSVLTTDVAGYKGGEYWCQDPIKKIEDIRGHTIAINTRGSTPEAAARILLERHGMQSGKDYQPVEMPFPASLPALESKKVDCAVLVSPWVNIVAKRPGLNMVFKIGDVFGETESTSWFGRPEWIKENRAALVDFVEDHIRMRHWCLDPKTQPEAVALAAQIGKQSTEALAYLWTQEDNYHEPNGLMSVTRFQRNLDDLHKYGLISAPVDAKKYIDTSIVEEAKARLNIN
jgi:NitT/TauT family transport system substrate-binding protein